MKNSSSKFEEEKMSTENDMRIFKETKKKDQGSEEKKNDCMVNSLHRKATRNRLQEDRSKTVTRQTRDCCEEA